MKLKLLQLLNNIILIHLLNKQEAERKYKTLFNSIKLLEIHHIRHTISDNGIRY